MLKKLCDIVAVSGYEDCFSNYLKNYLLRHSNSIIWQDNIGNIYVQKKASGKKILFLTHIDEVGIQISKKIDAHIYAFKTIGNLKTYNLFHQIIQFENNVLGIIVNSCEHNGIQDKISELRVFSFGELDVGDVGSFKNNFLENDEIICSKALDNRVGVFGIIEIICSELSNLPYDLYYCFSVQEEIGARGAKVAISTIAPDIVFTIDTTCVGERNNVNLGDGIAIKLSDSLAISDRKMTNKLKQLCINSNIKYQLEVSDCGTTEMIMVNEKDKGAISCGISIPCKDIHTSISVVNKNDMLEYKNLLKAIHLNLKQLVN